MTGAGLLYGLCGAALVGIGLYGLIVQVSVLRRIMAFNLIGSGVFLVFGAIAARAGDAVPHALIITGIVVALSATALAVALAVRLFQATGQDALPEDRAQDV